MATGTIPNPNEGVTALSKTYTSQSYVTQSNFALLEFYQHGRVVYGNINLNVSSSPGQAFRQIGTLTLPRNLITGLLIDIPSQDNNSALLFNITTNGTIQIYSQASATGWYRQAVTMLLS